MFFFFKQKTAYEMRISDWSSDVCSSDLQNACQQRNEADEEEVRKGDAAQRHRQFELARHRLEFAGQKPDERWHDDFEQCREYKENGNEYGKNVMPEALGNGLTTWTLPFPAEHRHKDGPKDWKRAV